MNGLKILNKVLKEAGDGSVYESAEDHFQKLAERWSAKLKTHITPEQAIRCLIEHELTLTEDAPESNSAIMRAIFYLTALAEVLPQNDGGEDE